MTNEIKNTYNTARLEDLEALARVIGDEITRADNLLIVDKAYDSLKTARFHAQETLRALQTAHGWELTRKEEVK